MFVGEVPGDARILSLDDFDFEVFVGGDDVAVAFEVAGARGATGGESKRKDGVRRVLGEPEGFTGTAVGADCVVVVVIFEVEVGTGMSFGAEGIGIGIG